MKRFLLSLFSMAIITYACGNQPSNPTEKISNGSVTTPGGKASNAKSYIQLTKADFIQEVWDYTKSPNDFKYLGDKPAIIDFYADWCGPCRVASPILEEIGTEYAGKIQVYKINTDQERELAQVFQITSIPAFLYIPASGKPVMMAGIGRSKEETKKMFIDNIEKYLLIKK